MLHELWLFRHGETEWSQSGAHTGRTDIPLTETGRARAAALGRWLAGRPFALVLVSPLGRAQETCALAGYVARAVIEPDLKEWDYGDYEGRTTAEIRDERPGWDLWSDGPLHGETLEQAAARARRVLQRVLDQSRSANDCDVALFAHGHILRILTACWLGLDPDAGRLFALSTGSVSVLGYEHETQVIRSWNVEVR